MPQQADSLMIFAAGFGTRMGALTATRPKPLIEVAGRPLIDRALARAEEAGIARIVVNTHYLGDRIADHLHGRNVAISHEWPEILDTGGGLRQALPMLGDGPVMTLNPDVIWAGPNPLALLRDAWDPAKMDALLLCLAPHHAIGRKGGGDFTLGADGTLTRKGDVIYGGAQMLDPAGLHDIPDRAFSLNRLWDRMIDDGRLYGVLYPGTWCDIGHPEGIALAEKMLAQADV
ncbi:nucleotidyltransferase family protein [Pseudooceanicola nanhaiensis]|jgi:MurNAc alpha-1-phosphate uridylyltransferase|uniref:Nucleotidyltransferase n=1 Tax=Pseudooceanicola nanhaiensis TaxID=375761 RepID=A0A917WJ56_9RHOB|nr:nucleotidyltransferase family protein [Pseudooceanicola nanhaiensis]GGM08142.1 nucleotidyltransferase [Pseudooceanicola nanhaiensis]